MPSVSYKPIFTTMTFQTLEVKYENMKIKGLLKKKKPQVVVKK